MRGVKTPAPSRTTLVAFEGALIQCLNRQDAIKLKKCALIRWRGKDGVSAAELERLADLLRRYGQQNAADRLARLADRNRTFKFLTGQGQLRELS